MATKIAELKQKRAKLIHDARTLVTTAETEKRELNSEENGKYDVMLSEKLTRT